MSVEFYRESPGKFASRTLDRKTLSRWTGRNDLSHPYSVFPPSFTSLYSSPAVDASGRGLARALCLPPRPRLYLSLYTCVYIYIYIYVYIYIYICVYVSPTPKEDGAASPRGRDQGARLSKAIEQPDRIHNVVCIIYIYIYIYVHVYMYYTHIRPSKATVQPSILYCSIVI